MTGKVSAAVLSLSGFVALGFAQASSGIDTKPDSREVKKLEEQAEKLDREAAHAKDNGRVFQSLSKKLGVPGETLKAQQQGTNFGFGQLFIANALAKNTGKTFDQIAQEIKNGRGWGTVARGNKARLGKILSDMRHSTAEMRRAHEKEMARQREEGRGEQRKAGTRNEPGSARARK